MTHALVWPFCEPVVGLARYLGPHRLSPLLAGGQFGVLLPTRVLTGSQVGCDWDAALPLPAKGGSRQPSFSQHLDQNHAGSGPGQQDGGHGSAIT